MSITLFFDKNKALHREYFFIDCSNVRMKVRIQGSNEKRQD